MKQEFRVVSEPQYEEDSFMTLASFSTIEKAREFCRNYDGPGCPIEIREVWVWGEMGEDTKTASSGVV